MRQLAAGRLQERAPQEQRRKPAQKGRPSGAEAQRVSAIYGTAEAVPLQSNLFFRKL
jgi:hypothetical protein